MSGFISTNCTSKLFPSPALTSTYTKGRETCRSLLRSGIVATGSSCPQRVREQVKSIARTSYPSPNNSYSPQSQAASFFVSSLKPLPKVKTISCFTWLPKWPFKIVVLKEKKQKKNQKNKVTTPLEPPTPPRYKDSFTQQSSHPAPSLHRPTLMKGPVAATITFSFG